MSYFTQYKLAQDWNLLNRVAACAATLGMPRPVDWANEHAWTLSAVPGWVEAYAGSTSDTPGVDENAITDEMILAEVERLINMPDAAPPAT